MLRRWIPRMVMLVPVVGLVAGSTSESRAAGLPQSAAPAPVDPKVMSIDAWLRTLPAPRTPDDHGAGPGPRVAWPVRGTVTQPFGCTGFSLEHPAADCPSGFHLGLDVAQPQGTPIRAAAAGLAYPMADPARYGNLVIIQHYGGYATVYGHMVRQAVSWGQQVQAGDVIGFVGSTGNSSGPHLHFEVRYAATAYDPVPYLSGSPADPAPLPIGWPGAPPDDWLGLR
ncbi:MAG TPA: M23 family metallopeptidase [Candidatus Dormibacteraeota bacterium]|nr:M23 family metallopeptidase [Candidatus Dormibacteraeota bacterium]